MSKLETDPGAGRSGADAGSPSDSLLTYCAAHPKVQTRLRCGKCGTPICPKCLVFTPVGARCRACADLRPLPQYQVSPTRYARAVGAALAFGLVGGALWAYIGVAIPFGLFGFLLALGIGYVAGEAISRATNRKRGRWLQVIAGASVVLAYVVRGLLPMVLRFPGLAADGGFLVTFAGQQIAGLFANPFGLIIVAVAIYIAVTRV